jgi:hypothetical protein
MYRKYLSIGIVLLLLASIIPLVSADDTTPPVTTISFDPSEPNGNNGWYVSDVNVTLNATDEESGVNKTYYRLNEGEWKEYINQFIVTSNGVIQVDYYSVDNAGNNESMKTNELWIDRITPLIELTWEAVGGNSEELIFTATCSDSYSGIERVEFYLNNELTFTDYSETYEWIMSWKCLKRWNIYGLILLKKVTKTNVTFYSIITRTLKYLQEFDIKSISYDNAGNSDYYDYSFDEQYLDADYRYFTELKVPNDFIGMIGLFRIDADFTFNPIGE